MKPETPKRQPYGNEGIFKNTPIQIWPTLFQSLIKKQLQAPVPTRELFLYILSRDRSCMDALTKLYPDHAGVIREILNPPPPEP